MSGVLWFYCEIRTQYLVRCNHTSSNITEISYNIGHILLICGVEKLAQKQGTETNFSKRREKY